MEILHQCYPQLLRRKKYCEDIMDDLLLFTPSQGAHMKVRRLIKGTTKEWIENIPKEVSVI